MTSRSLRRGLVVLPAKRGNPYLRAVAGTRLGMFYFNLSALRHVGRRSGRTYVTPLSAYPLGDGFVLAAAYPMLTGWRMCWTPANAGWHGMATSTRSKGPN
ncbi:hypothetical protein [Mycobacterium paraffinicum]|uniref:Uncharacterized protein n=1 Tax=Mycobacterium paraffinicum TaxID=53378 RepID=A0ABP8EZ35_9MYCO|nr:hypothetical protein [Mycobacterium paraffinicum]MCV7309915.1 hypothetical protein [Mycobacterium paraffinicum]